MAEIKGIDVSSYQGKIDWKSVASYGMGFAILRITEKGNIVDSTFEANYKGCIENKIPVGVYKYSYATTLTQIKEEANIVVKTLNKRTLNYPVFLDIEDKCQENLPSYLMMQMIDVFKEIIVQAGYKFGIYCGKNWYETKLPEAAKKYDCWLASYPSNDNGTLQEKLRPSVGIGWQYSSKATIPGIPTKVDRNVFYTDYSTTNPTTPNSSEIIQNVIDDAVEFAVNIAKDNTHGYSQKIRSLYNIDTSKSFDCSSLVCTAFYYAFIKNGLTKQAAYLKANCSYTGNMMKMLNCGFEVVATNQTAHAQMKKGDIELNINYHVALAIDKDNIVHARSSEGTTDTIDNSGNEIRTQPWYLYSTSKGGWNYRLRFTGKGIDFSGISSDGSTSSTSNTSSKPSTPVTSTGNQLIKNAQIHLNNFVGCNIKTDGVNGSETMKAFRKSVQIALNKDLGCNLKIDGIIGSNSKAALKKVALKTGSKGYLVTVVEIGMLLNNIDPKGVECPGSFWSGLESGVKCFQAKKGLVQDSIVGYNTLMALCS